MRLFFVALRTLFSAILLPVTERGIYVLYYPYKIPGINAIRYVVEIGV